MSTKLKSVKSKAQEVVIALDQGSGSSRALAFDARGRIVARAQIPIKAFYPKPGWVEHSPEEIVRSQEKALDDVLARLPKASRILGLGIASQRSTLIAWDVQTGKTLCPAVSWQDGRASEMVRALDLQRDAIHEKTGLYLTPYYSAPKLQWLLEHDPRARDARERGRLRIASVATYLLWKLTRGGLFAVDPTLAQRMLLLNVRTLDWDEELLRVFGVNREMLPALMPSSGDFGVIERKGWKIPALVMLGDQQSAALALGGEETDSGVLNYGTGAFFLVNAGTQARRVPGILTSIAWQKRGQECRYFQEGTVHAAGTSFAWLKENLGLLRRVEEIDAVCRRSKHRLLALQAIGGLGAPRWDYATFTTYMGMNSGTRPEDLVRAVTEGIAFLIADIVSALSEADLRVKTIRASGGLSQVSYLLRFQSSLLQMPIQRVLQSEATAMGAAVLAAEEAGAPWAAGFRAVQTEKEFRPEFSAEEAARLISGWRLFVETQQKLSSELRRLGVLS